MANLIVFLNLVALVVTIMIIWFKTNAFIEYCELLGLKFLLFGYNIKNDTVSFPQHLYIKSHTFVKSKVIYFLIALITCPLCFSFWLCIGAATLYGTILFTPLFYICSLVGYFLITRLFE